MTLIAANTSSLLNLNGVARDCGIVHNTAKKWLSVLETSGIIFLLEPYFANISKRLIKSPKIYFCDTGLLSNILRYPNAATLMTGPMAGNLFENFIIAEVYKYKHNQNALFDLYFFRDSNGLEVDLIMEAAGKNIIIEIKLAETIRMEHLKNIRKIMGFYQNTKAYVLGFYQQNHTTSEGIEISNWTNLYSILEENFPA